MDNEVAIQKSLDRHRTTKAIEHLLGMVDGMVADNHLHEKEVQLLSTWLTANPDATSVWPGSVIARQVREVLADGIITEDERGHLLQVLTELVATDFSDTGNVSPETSTLPLNDSAAIEIRDAGVCLTGEFLYGTRAACERLTEKAGGVPMGNVSKKVAILVIGTRVSPDWVHTSFGRKIQRAAELQGEGHGIVIISERRWMEALHPS